MNIDYARVSISDQNLDLHTLIEKVTEAMSGSLKLASKGIGLLSMTISRLSKNIGYRNFR